MFRSLSLSTGLAGLLILVASPALRAETAGAVAIPPTLQACAGVKKNSERLVCYDQAMAALLTPAKEGGKSVVTTATPETLFGVSAATARPTVSDDTSKPQSLEALTAKVKSVSTDANGSAIIELDNGQTWRQTGSGALMLQPGDEVTITRAAFNSFRISTPTGRAGRVKRVN